MKLFSKRPWLLSLVLCSATLLNAQTEITWSTSVEQEEGSDEATLIIKADLEPGWHVYSQTQESFDVTASVFSFDPSDDYELIGEVVEFDAITKYEEVFEATTTYFEDEAVFHQRIKLNTQEAFTIDGSVFYGICNEVMCLPPTDEPLAFGLNGGSSEVAELTGPEVNTQELIPNLLNVDLDNPVLSCGNESATDDENVGLWTLFLYGFLGGLFALLTPCVFPMIPLTVSFFTKGDQSRSKGIFNAALYGFFIFFIYAVLSVPFHFNADPEVLNEIATSVWLNIAFFAIFVFFAISFFGYFELTLPSKWANKTDSASNVGGLIGIFFMAITLALVSFSCTGPILGAVLAGSLSDGAWPVTAAMSGFGIALGLPFALFAMFPSMMKSLPQSGGWLTTVKVVIGFLELALALKFLSNADLVVQWELILRETFFLIWLLISLGLTAYLFGLIRFPHDPPRRFPKKGRLVFAILSLAFSVYLVPGVMENPIWKHDALSGFPPPWFYSWYERETEFHDFDEAYAYAQEVDKPLFVDFTGWACVNCRKMEDNVWPEEEIKELMENYVIVSLYVDDKVALPEELQGTLEIDYGGGVTKKKKIESIGDKWATFETLTFEAVSQPYYVLLSPDGYLLTDPVGYTPDVDQYAAFLQCGLDALEMLRSGDYDPDAVVIEDADEDDEEVGFVDPVKWEFSVEKIAEGEYDIVASASIQEGWHVYSQKIADDGPIPTTFYLVDGEGNAIETAAGEPRAVTEYDPQFEMDLMWFEEIAAFRIPFSGESGQKVSGMVSFMTCNDSMCLPPEDVDFTVVLE